MALPIAININICDHEVEKGEHYYSHFLKVGGFAPISKFPLIKQM
jgi:hypothetical protein